MSVKSREWIAALYPHSGKHVQPTSLDLRLADSAIIYDWPAHYRLLYWLFTFLLHIAPFSYSRQIRELKMFYAHRERRVSIREGFWLRPGQMSLLSSQEYVIIPDDAVAILTLKSSRGREGFDHALAGFFDSGFEGDAVFEVYAHNFPVYMYAGMPFAQLIFMDCDTPEQGYTGHYQGQRGPTPSWVSRGAVN